MADTLLQTPYATAMPYIVASPGGWTDEYDRQRMASYDLYDDLYNNDPSTYKLMLRESDERPILIPTAKKLVKTLARYVGKGWGFSVEAVDPELDPDSTVTPEQIQAAKIAYGKLFARERLLSRYRASVPEWLRRGDWLWFVSADPNKVEGSRISVRPIDPRRYFPIWGDPADASRVTGQQLIEETMFNGMLMLLVQTWRKSTDPLHPDYDPEAPEPEEGYDITYEVQAYDVADYQDPNKRKRLGHTSNLAPEYVAGITQLPIYHIRNNEGTDDPFGRSDLSGVESIVAGINQVISDEDIALALAGLGMYWTDSGAPVDEVTGEPTNWKMGPKRVIEVDDGKGFNRVSGIDDLDPYQDHAKYLEHQMFSTSGLSDVAVGTGSGSVAESGVALAIRYSPTIDEVRGKDELSNGVLTQMLWDLKEWFAAFEGLDLGDVAIISVTDSPESIIPFDREARFKELMDGIVAKVFTPEYAVSVLEAEFGYEFPAGYVKTLTDANAASAAALDPFAARASAELNAADEEPEEPSEDAPGVA